MSVFSASIQHRSFWWQISLLCFVLGLILAAAAHTASQITRSGVSPNRVGFVYGNGMQVAAEKAKEYEGEIKKLREKNAELLNNAAKGKDAATSINKELQDVKVYAALTEVTGPGVIVTLMDSQKRPILSTESVTYNNLVHDYDLRNVVNELRASGAEAVAVNGQRLGTLSSVRCVGPTVHVNDVPTAPPYVIQAIGDVNALYGGLNLPGGVLDEIRRYDPAMVRCEKKTALRLPAFAGNTQVRFARPVKPAPKSAEGSKSQPDGDKQGQ